jgi:hypothetical protein
MTPANWVEVVCDALDVLGDARVWLESRDLVEVPADVLEQGLDRRHRELESTDEIVRNGSHVGSFGSGRLASS